MVKMYKHNAAHLEEELQWLAGVIQSRYISHRDSKKQIDINKLKAPLLNNDDSIYKSIIQQFKLTNAERIILLLALVPHIRPFFLDDIANNLVENKTNGIYNAQK